MRKWITSIIILLLVLLPLKAQAQNAISLTTMTIEIWPEYDKPSALVIYRMTFSPATSFPSTVSVRIPTTAGNPNAVAERQADDSLYNLTYTRQVDGDWADVTFTTSASDIQLEYYDASLTVNGDARHYQYIWPGDYAISQLTIKVQQPAGATNMRIAPSLGAGVTGGDNLIYYTQDVGAVSAGQSIQITLDYQKTSDTLSVENVPVQPSGSIPQSAASDLNNSNLLPYIFGFLGAGLIIGGIIWYWQSGRQRPTQSMRRRRSRASKPEAAVSSVTVEDIYCSQCGKRAAPGDQFCRSCGTPLNTR